MFRLLPSRDTRLVVALLGLVLVPGFALAYIGLRGVTERENGLRSHYLATATLVRDRLVAELGRREREVWRAVATTGQLRLRLNDHRAIAEWLEALGHGRPWLGRMFLTDGDGLATRGLRANWRRRGADPLAGTPRIAALVAAAETAEFAQRDLETALRHYREARDQVRTGSPGAAFLHTRVGRTLLKMDRPADAIASYRRALAEAGSAVDRHGLPYAIIALVQIADGLEVLGRADEKARADRDLLEYVVDHPWDVADGLGVYLERGLSAAGAAEAALLARGQALAAEVAEIEWLQREVGPRLQAAPRPEAADDDGPGWFVIERDGHDMLVGLRWVDRSAPDPVALGYVMQPGAMDGDMLDAVVGSLTLDRGLTVRVHEAGASAGWPASAEALAAAPLFSGAPDWSVAVFDMRGRSTAQLVARERWTYGALVVGMLAVMVAGVVLIARTSRRSAELSRAKTQFVANVSHELKTPIALIRMFGETLEQGIVPDDGRRREFAGIIRRESERLTHLINNVLDLGRIDAGSKRYQFARADLVGTVRQAIDAYRPLFSRLDFDVEVDLPRQPIDVTMDRDAVVQSLVNLFQNVIKYSDEDRYVRVAVARDADWARVTVADRGIGIAADEIPRVFEPYYRAAGARAAAPAGSGLGLSIVQHAIAAHGGRIDVASTPGSGSTFTLLFPLTPAVAIVASGEPVVARTGS